MHNSDKLVRISCRRFRFGPISLVRHWASFPFHYERQFQFPYVRDMLQAQVSSRSFSLTTSLCAHHFLALQLNSLIDKCREIQFNRLNSLIDKCEEKLLCRESSQPRVWGFEIYNFSAKTDEGNRLQSVFHLLRNSDLLSTRELSTLKEWENHW